MHIDEEKQRAVLTAVSESEAWQITLETATGSATRQID